MAKIVLDTVTGGYDLSIINNNFDKIEAALQDEVLYRDNPVGEPNTLQTSIDANAQIIYNLPEPLLSSQAARLQDVQNALAGGAANLITFTPYGTVVSNNIQSAVQELIDDTTPNGVALPLFLKNSSVIVVSSISALKAIDKTKFTKAIVLGYYSEGDGGGGVYWFDSSDTTSSDNAGTIIVATDTGRWKLATTGVLSVKQFGAKGDGVTNDVPAFNAATVWCINNGLKLFIPGDTYLHSSTWTINLSSVATLAATTRITIEGAGKANTLINYGGGPGTQAIAVLGDNWATGGASNRLVLKGFRVAGWDPTPAVNIVGLAITQLIGAEFSDLEFIQFNTGCVVTDLVAASFNRCDFSFNNYGWFGWMGPGGFADGSPPNELNFNECHFIANRQHGLYAQQGGPINFYGGSFEGNGNTGPWASDADRGSIFVENVGGNSGCGVLLDGVHFEGNAGKADLWIRHHIYPATYSITGCSFMRNGSAQQVTNNILFETTGASKSSLCVVGTGFTEVNGYVPTGATAYIKYGTVTGNIHQFSEFGNIYLTAAGNPSGAGITGTRMGPDVMASAYVNFNGAASPTINQKHNVASLTRNGVGDYTINFERAMKVGVFTISGGAVGNCVISKVGSTTTTLRIQTLNAATAAATDFAETSVIIFAGGNLVG